MALAYAEVFQRIWDIDSVYTHLLDAETSGEFEKNHWSSHKGEGEGWGYEDNWHGTKDFAENLQLIERGWEDGVTKLDTVPNAKMADSLRPEMLWDVVGSDVDIASYMGGNPECMGEMVRRKRPTPVVKIGVDRVASAGVDRSKIERVGRNVLLLVESLRLAGIPAEIWACEAVAGSRRKEGGRYDTDSVAYDLRVKVQDAGRHLDVSRMAYWMAHPSVLRRTFFALEELEPQHIRKCFGFDGGHYGMPITNYAKSEFDEWAPGPNESEAHIQKWVEDVLTRRTNAARR